MALLANVALSNTFDSWRIRTNQILSRLNAFAINESSHYANTLTANVALVAKSSANVNFLGTGTVLDLKVTKFANTVTLIGGSRLLFGHSITSGSNPIDAVFKNTSLIRWLNGAGTSGANFGIAANTGLNTNSDSLRQVVPTANGELQMSWAGVLGGWFKKEFTGMSLMFNGTSTADHSIPASGRTVIYTKNEAIGDPQLIVRFATGLPRTIAAPTSAINLPVGNTAQRPTGGYANGSVRYNKESSKFEGFKGGSWGTLGGGATGGGVDEVFIENSQIVSSNYTISSGKSAVSAGPITVSSGIIVTIPSGSRWVIV